MFVEAGGVHHRPHFHAYYRAHAAVFEIDSVECLGGELPVGPRRLVEAWAEIHRSELETDRDLLQSGRPPVNVDALGLCSGFGVGLPAEAASAASVWRRLAKVGTGTGIRTPVPWLRKAAGAVDALRLPRFF